MSNAEKSRLLSCSFCGKSQREVRTLVAGPAAYICDECVEGAKIVIAESQSKSDDRFSLSPPPRIEGGDEISSLLTSAAEKFRGLSAEVQTLREQTEKAGRWLDWCVVELVGLTGLRPDELANLRDAAGEVPRDCYCKACREAEERARWTEEVRQRSAEREAQARAELLERVRSFDPSLRRGAVPTPKGAPAVPGIYFVEGCGTGLLKIGMASDIRHRLQGLQGASPVPLLIHGWVKGARVEELAFHVRWASLRVHGEWFRFTGDLRQFVVDSFGEVEEENHDVSVADSIGRQSA